MTGKTRQRLMRPVERQSMRDWLSDRLNGKEIPGLEWLDKDQRIFQIKWCHGSRHGWSIKDSVIFERWAQHSGRHNDGDPKRWKANFRCALNSLKNVEEVKDLSISKGLHAFRVYKMLDCPKKTDTSRVIKPRIAKPKKSDAEKDMKCVPKVSTVALRTTARFTTSPYPSFVKNEYPDQDLAIDASEESESEGYQTDVQDDTCMDWSTDDRTKFPASTNTGLPSINEVKTDETEDKTVINLPNFDKIIPGFCKVALTEPVQKANKNILEFGKMHLLPRHGSGFKVELLQPQTPLTPILRPFPTSLPISNYTQPTTSTAEFSLTSPAGNQTSVSTSTASSISQVVGHPVGHQVSLSQTNVSTQQTTSISLPFSVPADNQFLVSMNSPAPGYNGNYEHVTFPETPDGSDASHDSNSGDFVEVTVYVEEVNDSSTPSPENSIVLTGISTTTMMSLPGITHLSPHSYYPLTPP